MESIPRAINREEPTTFPMSLMLSRELRKGPTTTYLRFNGVNTPGNKQGRTDYISNVVNAFKRIKKGSNYYLRILVWKKPKGNVAYKDKMETRFDIS